MPRRRLTWDEREATRDTASREERQARMLERALLQRRPTTPGVGGAGDMQKTTYDANQNGIVDLSENVVLPASAGAPGGPVAADEGRFFYRRPGGGEPSELYCCMLNSEGELEWIIVGVTS